MRKTSQNSPCFLSSSLEDDIRISHINNGNFNSKNDMKCLCIENSPQRFMASVHVKITYNRLVTSFTEVHYFASVLRNFALNNMQIYHTCHITVHNVFQNNIVFSLEKCGTKLQTLYVNLQIPICYMLVQLLKMYDEYCKRNPYSTKKSLYTVM